MIRRLKGVTVGVFAGLVVVVWAVDFKGMAAHEGHKHHNAPASARNLLDEHPSATEQKQEAVGSEQHYQRRHHQPLMQQEPAKPEPNTSQPQHQYHQPEASPRSSAMAEASQRQNQSAEPRLRLEDLERMALQKNPTLAQAEAAIRAAEGRRVQVGLYPNPIIGYDGDQFSFRSFSNKSEHFFFIEQTIVTAGKLKKSREVIAQEKVQAEFEAEAQKQRVLNAVRLLYYEALGAQQLVELRRQLANIATEAVSISAELYNIGQADRPDVLESEVEAQRSEIELIRAENNLARIWQLLAVVVGDPSLKVARLEGDLEAEVPRLNMEAALARLLNESPEIKSARAALARARAGLVRAKAEPKPNLFVRGGIGYSTEPIELIGRKTGPEARIEVGVRLPLFDRNQGNIAAAEAEILRAEREVERLELALRARLATAFNRYYDALRVVERYQQSVLPRAQRAYELYLASFRQMAASYPQVLIAQRTLFQVRTDYIASLVDLWQSVTDIRGMLLKGGLNAPGAVAGSMDSRSQSSGEH